MQGAGAAPLLESRGTASGGVKGQRPLGSSINARKLYEEVTNSIAKKGQGRNSLAESRGSAHWVSLMKGKKAMRLSTSTCMYFNRPDGTKASILDSVRTLGQAGYRVLDMNFHDLSVFDTPFKTPQWETLIHQAKIGRAHV